MINKYIITTNRILGALADIERQQYARFLSLKKYDGYLLKENKRDSGKSYYTIYKSDGAGGILRSKYAGDPSNEAVMRIREVRHLKKSLSVLKKNIKLLKKVSENLEEIDAEHINSLLPAIYRASELHQAMPADARAAAWKRKAEAYKATFEPYRPEELTVPTDDGNYVRSKSEALIYNFLLKMGVTFVYELPLKTKVRTFYPDFTILSEIDYCTEIIIEHQGMMAYEEYRERFKKRVYDYLRAGYVQGINIFYTFDFKDGGVDTSPVLDIIRLKIRPEAAKV